MPLYKYTASTKMQYHAVAPVEPLTGIKIYGITNLPYSCLADIYVCFSIMWYMQKEEFVFAS